MSSFKWARTEVPGPWSSAAAPRGSTLSPKAAKLPMNARPEGGGNSEHARPVGGSSRARSARRRRLREAMSTLKPEGGGFRARSARRRRLWSTLSPKAAAPGRKHAQPEVFRAERAPEPPPSGRACSRAAAFGPSVLQSRRLRAERAQKPPPSG